MCGRFTLKTDPRKLTRHFDAGQLELFPRYNIAPSQPILTLRTPEAIGGTGAVSRQWAMIRWGLVPSWAKDETIGHRMINARSETVAEKPAFRSAFKYRRCLIPCDGFFEWERVGRKKQPFYFQLADENVFAMAGLWEHWQDANGNELETCTVLTTTANALLADIHDRMPVILQPTDYERWLSPATDAADLLSLLKPFEAQGMKSMAVSTVVNSPSRDDASCIQPAPTDLFGGYA